MKENSNTRVAITKSQKRMLAFGAILFHTEGQKILSVSFKNEYELFLNEIKDESQDREIAIKNLQHLLELGESKKMDYLIGKQVLDATSVKKEISKKMKVSLQQINPVNSTYAWDICRLVAKSKWYFWAGYITREEMWNFISKGVEQASEHGDDWESYTISFLIGRKLAGFEIDGIVKQVKQVFFSRSPFLRKIKDIDVYKKYQFKYNKVIYTN
ncbi:DUF1266 domain-containing protein [Tenacibaculum jejuense]|uniref:DUF1266 domain-containing protein n=1 Tax=Tenacibaculum jejuense TaxID=584609 RepID=A0A238U6J2_9FLAO|nr:DUF1266 domain-containing protein [Tenacibaculum jejuense]SNR14208.1 conserved protein of unknown function [Tenacibaculum jejuense]